ncbi:MAG: hypothetical protein IJW13_00005, partial [Clostridia bacterium]|nr:hypothetical protein [Clostridia bacterium]
MTKQLSKTKKNILNVAITLLVLVSISVIFMLVFMATNIIYFDDGIHFNLQLFQSFKDSWVGWVVFILLQTVFTILLCFIPGVSMALIVVCQALYNNPIEAFALSFISVMISSTIMYALGRFGGYKLCTKILGDE